MIPVGPVGPVAPASPVAPVAPVAPVGPAEPVGPVAPVSPVAPVAPVSPVLPVAPVVRHRETFLDPEYLLQAGGEVGDGLHVVVGRIDHGAKMVEVDVGHQEFPAGSQYPGDLLELLGLMAAHVLEDAQRNDDVESLGAKRDVVLDEVSLNQIGSGLLDGDVQTVVADVGGEESPQARRSASERTLALRGSFRVARCPPVNVVLVDDVLTSGATGAECARTLLGAQAGGAKTT